MKSRRLEPRARVGVVGKTGQGKSNWVKDLIADEMAAGVPILGFDPLDELSEFGAGNDEVRLGPLTDRITVRDLMALTAEQRADLLCDPSLALAVVPEEDGGFLAARGKRPGPDAEEEEFAEQYRIVAREVRATGKATGGLLFVSEELGTFEAYARGMLNKVGTTFRHHGVAAVFSAQRLVQIPRTARTQLSELIAFRTDDPEDLEQIARVTKDDDFAERVARLTPGHFEHWRDDAAAIPAGAKRRLAK